MNHCVSFEIKFFLVINNSVIELLFEFRKSISMWSYNYYESKLTK